MSELKFEKVEHELELNGEKAKFVASTLNLDYVLIGENLYLGLDWYGKDITNVKETFATKEAIVARAEQIVALNEVFEFAFAADYDNYHMVVFCKDYLGYVALIEHENLLAVVFHLCTERSKQDLQNIAGKDFQDLVKQWVEFYQDCLKFGESNRNSDYGYIKDVGFTRICMDVDDDDSIEVTDCRESEVENPCLHCGEYIEYNFKPQQTCITTCKYCGAVFEVDVVISATMNYTIQRRINE